MAFFNLFKSLVPSKAVRYRSLEMRVDSSIITITIEYLTTPFGGNARTSGPSIFASLRQWFEMWSEIRRFRRASQRMDCEWREEREAFKNVVTLLASCYQSLQGFKQDSDLAEALGVTPTAIAGWKVGVMPDQSTFRLLRDVAVVISKLLDYYDRSVVSDWLYGQNPDLDGRQPIELLREGNLADVLAAADAQISGAYI